MNAKYNILLRKNFTSLFRICRNAWKDSETLVNQKNVRFRLPVFLDMLFSLLLFGADSTDYRTFEFHKMNFRGRNAFITYIRNVKLRLWTSEEAFGLFDNKGLFNKRYADFITRGWMTTKNRSSQDIIDFIDKYRTVIVKPPTGTWGIGIYKLSYLEKDNIERLIGLTNEGKEFIIEECIENINSIKSLNPSSLNTLRIVTCVDKSGKTHVIKSLIRIGASDSCVDNASTGGITCSVNYKLGIIDSAGKSISGNTYLIHPISQMLLLGYPIPYWEGIEQYINEITKVEPKARYVGWDIAITDSGFELIEGNMSPGVNITQMCDMVGKWKQIKPLV